MALLPRSIQKIFGLTGQTDSFAQIGSQNAGTPLLTKDLTTIQALAQYEEGLVGVVVNQGDTGLPRLQDVNSLYFLITSQLAYIFQNGLPEWINSVDQRYYANISFVQVNGVVYQAILGDDATNINAQRDPTTEPTWWRVVRTPTERGRRIGDLSFNPGNVIAPSALDPYFCLTNFETSTTVLEANWPEYIPWLRSQQVIYLEGQTGETSQFAGTVAGSTITLDNNAANLAVLAALAEDQAAFGSFTDYRTVDIDGTTFPITAIDADPGTRTIDITGTPTAGAQNAIFYPYRIAGSTTSARLFSYRGRSPIGSGTLETVSGGLLRRDRFQAWQLGGTNTATDYYGIAGAPGNTVSTAVGANDAIPFLRTTVQGDAERLTAFNDGTNGDPRTGIDTHGPDFSTHIYQYGVRFEA